MRALVSATAALWLVCAPAFADEGRTGRGADADRPGIGDRAREMQPDQSSRPALLMVQTLIDELVEEGVLSREGARHVLNRAKALSAAGCLNSR